MSQLSTRDILIKYLFLGPCQDPDWTILGNFFVKLHFQASYSSKLLKTGSTWSVLVIEIETLICLCLSISSLGTHWVKLVMVGHLLRLLVLLAVPWPLVRCTALQFGPVTEPVAESFRKVKISVSIHTRTLKTCMLHPWTILLGFWKSQWVGACEAHVWVIKGPFLGIFSVSLLLFIYWHRDLKNLVMLMLGLSNLACSISRPS